MGVHKHHVGGGSLLTLPCVADVGDAIPSDEPMSDVLPWGGRTRGGDEPAHGGAAKEGSKSLTYLIIDLLGKRRWGVFVTSPRTYIYSCMEGGKMCRDKITREVWASDPRSIQEGRIYVFRVYPRREEGRIVAPNEPLHQYK